MRLALLGMSGVGKSYWAGRLAGAGFEAWHCDDRIAARLREELDEALVTVEDMGRWMGFPDDAGYREKEQRYLACEEHVLRGIVADLSLRARGADELVIDLTGSAIYAGGGVLAALRPRATIIHLATSPNALDGMCRAYAERPRPLIWRDHFRRRSGETRASALARCYRDLVASRERLYAAASDVTIDYHAHRHPALPVEDFLRRVTPQGPP